MQFSKQQQSSPDIQCQYARHNEQPCKYICIDRNCYKKKISCMSCFQDKDYHLDHQGLTVEEFKQKVDVRLYNLQKLIVTLDNSKKIFNNFILEQEQSVQALIDEAEKYFDIKELQKVQNISIHFRLEQNHFAPYLQYQLEKIQQKIKNITQFIKNIDSTYNEEDLNEIKTKVINIIKEKQKDISYYENAITELNKGLKKYPTNCSLISLKCICLTNLQQVEEAKKLIEYAFQINQNDETVLLFKAKLKLEEKKYDECIQLYELAKEPNQYLARFKLDALKQLKKDQEFKGFEEQCLRQFGQNFNKEYSKRIFQS